MGGGGSKKKKAEQQQAAGAAPVQASGAGFAQEGDTQLISAARIAINDSTCKSKYNCPDAQPLGCGAYASVWRAIDTKDGSAWALKIIDKNHGKCDEQEMISVRWEAKALEVCNHPNVTGLREVFETSTGGAKNKGFFYLVMEVMRGGELFDRIIEREHYSETDARDAVKSMCEALQFCHQSNVIHLDMKPENVLYAAQVGDPNCDILKLCDFGISKSTADGVPGVLNGKIQADGHLHGTPSYLAPEMIRRAEYDGKADVWAIGVITYILLGGIPPFDEPPELMDTPQGTEQMFKDILRGDFYPFEEYECDPGEENPWNSVSEIAKNFIRTLLTPDPAKRPDFTGALEHAWMHPEADISKEHLGDSHSALKKFNAKKKFKGAINKVRGAIRISKIMSFAGKIKAGAIAEQEAEALAAAAEGN